MSHRKNARTAKRPKVPKLTDQQARLVREYLKDFNQRRAGLRAGYARKAIASNMSHLFKKPHVAAAVEAARVKLALKDDLTLEMLRDRLRLIAFQDIRTLYDEDGNLLPIDALSDEAAAMVAGIEVIKKNAEAGDGIIDTIHKVKLVDQLKAQEMLGKHLGLLVDKLQLDVNGRIRLVDERAPDDELIARAEELIAKAKLAKAKAAA